MEKSGRGSLVAGGIAAALLVAAVAVKLGHDQGADPARVLTLLSFGLLLTVLGNLVPKIAPVADGRSDLRHRGAGRVLVITGIGLLATALVAHPDLALVAGSVLGASGLALAGVVFFFGQDRKETPTMSFRTSHIRRAILLLFVGLGGAFGLIVLDRLFGDQVAQWSAVVWVLILGFVTVLTLPGISEKR